MSRNSAEWNERPHFPDTHFVSTEIYTDEAIFKEELRVELRVEPRLHDVGPLLDQVGTHRQEGSVAFADCRP